MRMPFRLCTYAYVCVCVRECVRAHVCTGNEVEAAVVEDIVVDQQ